MLALATVDGDAADLRTVVLREVDASQQTLVFFTDARSPKVAQLQAHPQATLMVWSAALAWQLRLKARLVVQTDGAAVTSRWARMASSPAASDYLSARAPGMALPLPLSQTQTQPEPHLEPEPDTNGPPQFAVVTATVQAIDWLELHADGHRRARFDTAGHGQWTVP